MVGCCVRVLLFTSLGPKGPPPSRGRVSTGTTRERECYGNVAERGFEPTTLWVIS